MDGHAADGGSAVGAAPRPVILVDVPPRQSVALRMFAGRRARTRSGDEPGAVGFHLRPGRLHFGRTTRSRYPREPGRERHPEPLPHSTDPATPVAGSTGSAFHDHRPANVLRGATVREPVRGVDARDPGGGADRPTAKPVR